MHRAHIPAMRWDMAKEEAPVRMLTGMMRGCLNLRKGMMSTGREHFAYRSQRHSYRSFHRRPTEFG